MMVVTMAVMVGVVMKMAGEGDKRDGGITVMVVMLL